MSGDQELKVALANIASSLTRLEEKLEDLSDDSKDLKSAVYKPHTGLYAQLAQQGADIDQLQRQVNSYAKGLWLAGSVIVGLFIETVFSVI